MTRQSVPDQKAQQLQQAFDVFNQVSLELTQAYEGLQAKVGSLTQELALANGELRRQYQEKEALSERLSLLLNALPAGVIVLDGSGQINEANPASLEMFGANLLGRNWAKVAQDMLEPTEAPDEWGLGERQVSILESAFDSAGGHILLVHDITAAHRLKNDLERNKRLAAMGEMAASLAHQLRTPLATAMLYSANLEQEVISDTARVRFAQRATAQLQRLERLIQDVLLFARGESIGRDIIEVDALMLEVAQTMEPLCRAQGVEFMHASQVAGAMITGSRKALVGALLSLLENALQACETANTCKIGFNAIIEENQVKIMVSDTGKGIPEPIKTRIFEPFFTTRGQGTGLGLPIVRGVARAHGGSIEVTSEAGIGTEFILSLPVGSRQ